ncbi:MAG: carboxylating nicotinate-nucleotide diphosphorylase [Chitinophagales bacterium]|nr:carboxylating nicotinate-nucleotide diphosphorylase [Chitinophagales bacterium]
MTIEEFIRLAILEDTQDPNGVIPQGDHSALSCLNPKEKKRARLIIKDAGIIAGLDIAKNIFQEVDKNLEVQILLKDGDELNYGDIGLEVHGSATSILLAERLVLNTMQRMSGIATKTRQFAKLIAHTKCKVLDTRKTTPNFRYFEKLAVKIGGGVNHRFGLYDMIMLKDNHVDYCGGIAPAITRAKEYIKEIGVNLPIEVETRNLDEVKQVCEAGGVYRIMLDNFSVEKCKEAVDFVAGKIPLEASGGITLETIVSYAETGVDYVSVGSLTYSYKSLDISLKAY